MSIKLHKVIHCFDSLIILLYEHPFTIYCDTHRWPDLNVIDVWLYKPDTGATGRGVVLAICYVFYPIFLRSSRETFVSPHYYFA